MRGGSLLWAEAAAALDVPAGATAAGLLPGPTTRNYRDFFPGPDEPAGNSNGVSTNLDGDGMD